VYLRGLLLRGRRGRGREEGREGKGEGSEREMEGEGGENDLTHPLSQIPGYATVRHPQKVKVEYRTY